MDKLYPPVNTEDIAEHYIRHVEAMTREGLHEKSAIAAQLAQRDATITDLRRKLAEAERELQDTRKDYCGFIDQVVDKIPLECRRAGSVADYLQEMRRVYEVNKRAAAERDTLRAQVERMQKAVRSVHAKLDAHAQAYRLSGGARSTLPSGEQLAYLAAELDAALHAPAAEAANDQGDGERVDKNTARELRHKLALRLKDVADGVGLSVVEVSAAERGKGDPEHFAKVLGWLRAQSQAVQPPAAEVADGK